MTETYWTELRIFLEVARARSFNKAAQQLGVTHPTIARAVRRLENALGIQLIAEAFARGVKLTPQGEHLSRQLSLIDRRLAAVVEQLSV